MGKKLTIEEFKKRANIIHNNKFDYSESIYRGMHESLSIMCPIHGKFKQTPNIHIHNGSGCSKCSEKYNYTTKEWVNLVLKKYPENKKLYDYSFVEYKNRNTKVKIFCNKCNDFFEQLPYTHLEENYGCSRCSGIYNYTTKEWVNLVLKKHPENKKLYDYSLTNYVNNSTEIEIKCCGCNRIFKQRPSKHLLGRGCSFCNKSRGERRIMFILDRSRKKFKTQFKIKACKNILPLPFDFKVDDVLIEYQGKQHYEPVEFFGGMDGFIKRQHNDNIKLKYCREHNIKLIQISYQDFNNIKNILLKENII